MLRNKMRAEVTSYRLAINEAWEVLEGTLPSDTLRAMRAAESSLTKYPYGSRAARRDDDVEPDDDAADDAADDDAADDALARRGVPYDDAANASSSSAAEASSHAASRAKRSRGSSTSGRTGSGSGSVSQGSQGKGAGARGSLVAASSEKIVGPLARVSGGCGAKRRARLAHRRARRAGVDALFAVRRVNGPRVRRGASVPAARRARQVARGARLESRRREPRRRVPLHGGAAVRVSAAVQQRSEQGVRGDAAQRAVARDVRVPARGCAPSRTWCLCTRKRRAHTGGVHLVLRLSEVHRIQSELEYDAVVAAIVSHVEQQWLKLGVAGSRSSARRVRATTPRTQSRAGAGVAACGASRG